ncbi:TPA: ribonuclease III [Candidatus Acetothermia bacterium]|nr:ribonuclease III [Candidatus Acetothermia bacterium]HAZ30018.1 ribonuclease III [Candidatus Acetothermia bacterium]
MTPGSSLSALLARLGLELPEEDLRTALTHDSYANEQGGGSNERLEFLGDAVLDLAVADTLFRLFPDRDEGDLSKLRAVVVSRPVLAEVAEGLGLGEFLLLGAGAEEGGARTRPSVLAAALEAVVGAVFLHHGYAAAVALADELLRARINAEAEVTSPDYKSLLQEFSQARFGTLPRYEVLAADGPDHKKVFTVQASLPVGTATGRGRSKKEAEHAAAKRLYVRLSEETGD